MATRKRRGEIMDALEAIHKLKYFVWQRCDNLDRARLMLAAPGFYRPRPAAFATILGAVIIDNSLFATFYHSEFSLYCSDKESFALTRPCLMQRYTSIRADYVIVHFDICNIVLTNTIFRNMEEPRIHPAIEAAFAGDTDYCMYELQSILGAIREKQARGAVNSTIFGRTCRLWVATMAAVFWHSGAAALEKNHNDLFCHIARIVNRDDPTLPDAFVTTISDKSTYCAGLVDMVFRTEDVDLIGVFTKSAFSCRHREDERENSVRNMCPADYAAAEEGLASPKVSLNAVDSNHLGSNFYDRSSENPVVKHHISECVAMYGYRTGIIPYLPALGIRQSKIEATLNVDKFDFVTAYQYLMIMYKPVQRMRTHGCTYGEAAAWLREHLKWLATTFPVLSVNIAGVRNDYLCYMPSVSAYFGQFWALEAIAQEPFVYYYTSPQTSVEWLRTHAKKYDDEAEPQVTHHMMPLVDKIMAFADAATW